MKTSNKLLLGFFSFIVVSLMIFIYTGIKCSESASKVETIESEEIEVNTPTDSTKTGFEYKIEFID